MEIMTFYVHVSLNYIKCSFYMTIYCHFDLNNQNVC